MKKRSIKNQLSFLRFVANNCSDHQLEDILFEIQPEQLEAVRQLFKAVTKKNPEKFLPRYISSKFPNNQKASKSKKAAADRLEKRLKKFTEKLLEEKASRPNLRQEKHFIRDIVVQGLQLLDDSQDLCSVRSCSEYQRQTPISESGNKSKDRRKKKKKETFDRKKTFHTVSLKENVEESSEGSESESVENFENEISEREEQRFSERRKRGEREEGEEEGYEEGESEGEEEGEEETEESLSSDESAITSSDSEDNGNNPKRQFIVPRKKSKKTKDRKR